MVSLQIKYEDQLYEICSEGSKNLDTLAKLQNHGVDFNMFVTVSIKLFS